jgi:hypothetical protein
MPSEARYSLSEVARMLSVSNHLVRFWCDEYAIPLYPGYGNALCVNNNGLARLRRLRKQREKRGLLAVAS